MNILIASDAWMPQVNGVVRTLCTTREHLEALGHHVTMVTPDQFFSVRCPTYPEIRLALTRPGAVSTRIEAARPDAIHIATEGPLGLAVRRHCLKHRLPFTTAFHTRFPDYIAARTPLSPNVFWRYLRWFHGPSSRILTATRRLADELASHGLEHTAMWSRGVDLTQFSPDGPHHPQMQLLYGPRQLYVGRVAVEKNIEAFLRLDTQGSKIVVGDGPARASLQRAYPQALFLGALQGEALASAFRSADVFVFPSLTDTFGLVMLEAMACGVPVAAFPVAGPLDILGINGRGVDGTCDQPAGALSEDLAEAIRLALTCERATCATFARGFSWELTTRQFLNSLEVFGSGAGLAQAA